MLCLVLLIAGMLGACAGGKSRLARPQPLSTLQRAAMQTKELQGDFNTAFAATISVLQDEGWQIDVVDKPSGIIQASSLKRQDIIGPADDWQAERDAQYRDGLIKKAAKNRQGPGLIEWTRWEQLTAHIELWGTGSVRQRITITTFGSLPTAYAVAGKKKGADIQMRGGKEQSAIIENPVAYQYLFQQIQRAVFVRQGLNGHQ